MNRKPLLEEKFAVSFDLSIGTSELEFFDVQLYNNELVFLKEGEAPSLNNGGWLNWLWSSKSESTTSSTGTKHIVKQLELKSVIGAHASMCDGSASRASVEIYSYPKRGDNQARYRQQVTLFYDPIATYDNSLEVALRWKRLISYFLNTNIDQHDPALVNDFVSGKIIELPVKKRKLLILLNPVSGPAAGRDIFKTRVANILKEAEINYTLLITERSGHANELIKHDPNLFQYDSIVTASGDGLFYEVINGLLSRADWQKAMRIPLGIIPVGSGNSLSGMICSISGETALYDHVIQATYLLTKSLKPKPYDLLAVDTVDGRKYSFLSLAWGLISDIDIESEHLRFLGGKRFMIQSVIRTLSLRKYRGRLSFLPANDDNRNECKRPLSENKDTKQIDTPLLPPLQDPVPKNWVTFEDDFVGVIGTHCSHVSSDSVMHPSIKFDDGCIYLMIMRASALNRRKIARHLYDMSQGVGVANGEGLEWHRVLAFRIEPAAPTSNKGHILTLDGERISYGPAQAQILPEAACLL